MDIKEKNILSEQAGDNLNLMYLFYQLLGRWYVFVISIIVAVVLAFIVLRYYTPTYRVSASIKIDKKNEPSISASKLFSNTGGDLFGNDAAIEDEIYLLKSYKMLQSVVKESGFGISYYQEGKVKQSEFYAQESPIKVVFDSTHLQAVSTKFFIKILSDSTYNLTYEGKRFNLYDYSQDIISVYESPELIKYSETVHFAKEINTSFYKFKVYFDKKSVAKTNEYTDLVYFFKFNNIDEITQSYKTKLKLDLYKKGSTVLVASLEGANVKKEIDFLDNLLGAYVDLRFNEKNKVAENTVIFIDDQLKDISNSLTGVEAELEKFRANYQIMDLSSQASAAYEKMQKAEKEQSDIKIKQRYYSYLQDYIDADSKSELIAPSSIGIEDPVLINLISTLTTLTTKKASLKSTVSSESPAIAVIENQIESVKKELKANLKQFINSLTIEAEEINKRFREIEFELGKLPLSERKLVDIQRRYTLNNNINTFLLEKRAEAAIAKAANTPSDKILDNARQESRIPISPKPFLLYTLFVLIAIVVPLVSILFIININPIVSSVSELERITQIPLLGTISSVVLDKKNLVDEVIVLDSPKSSFSESFRALRINIDYVSFESANKRVIAVSSFFSGEGKTFIASNLAGIFSLTGKTVIVIGADLRKPRLQDSFGIPTSAPGISSYLVGKATLKDVIVKTRTEGLDLIVSGPIPPNPSELLSSKAMKNLIKELKSLYDIVIIDTAPIGLVADYFTFQDDVDLLLYVVRHKYTKTPMIKMFNRMYLEDRFKQIGLVYNDLSIDRISSAYGKSYGGYGYGGYGYGTYGEESGGYFSDNDKKAEKKGIISRLFNSEKTEKSDDKENNNNGASKNKDVL